MRTAVAEAARRKQREDNFRKLARRRARLPSLSSEELRAACVLNARDHRRRRQCRRNQVVRAGSSTRS